MINIHINPFESLVFNICQYTGEEHKEQKEKDKICTRPQLQGPGNEMVVQIMDRRLKYIERITDYPE